MPRIALLSLFLLFSLFTAVPQVAGGDRAIKGTASHYGGTAGWVGTPHLALAGGLGGRYTGHLNGYVQVCAERCANLPAVDTCQCYWGTADQRVVDLSPEAWALVSDQPLDRGLIPVTITLGPLPAGDSPSMPNTAFR